jgi:hypothetical protein
MTVLLPLFCFYVSRQEKMSLSVILAHSSQLESTIGNVGEYRRSRFNQDIMVPDATPEQLNDARQLQLMLDNRRAAKENHCVIIAKASLLNVLQLTFQEACDDFNHACTVTA